MFIEFDGPTLQTSLVSLDVAGSGQTISLSTGSGSIAVDGVDGDALDPNDGFDANTQNDHFVLRTGGVFQNIAFAGATTLTGATVTLNSSGAIQSGAATDVVSLTGDITLSAVGAIGVAGNELLYQSAANVNASGGANIHLRQATGNLLFSRFAQLSSSAPNAIVSVGTVSGNVDIDAVDADVSVADDHLQVFAGGTGNITFGGPPLLTAPLTARRVTLDAGGNISGGTLAIDVSATGDAVNGGVTLRAGGGIGTNTDAFSVQAGAGQVTATTGGADATGNIYLTSTGPLRLGAIATHGSTQEIHLATTGGGLTIDALSSTTDIWRINAAGDVSFLGNGRIEAHEVRITAAGTVTGSPLNMADIDTSSIGGLILLSGTSLGTPLQPLQLDSGGGLIDLRALAGDIAARIENAGGLDTSDLRLQADAGGRVISLDVAGELEFDSVAGFISTGDDHFVVRTVNGAHDILFTNPTPFTAASIELNSSRSIFNHAAAVSSDTPVLTPTGLLTLTAAEDIGASGQPLVVSPGGQLIVTAGDDIFLRVPGTLQTSKFLSLTSLATTGGFVSLSSGAVTVDGELRPGQRHAADHLDGPGSRRHCHQRSVFRRERRIAFGPLDRQQRRRSGHFHDRRRHGRRHRAVCRPRHWGRREPDFPQPQPRRRHYGPDFRRQLARRPDGRRHLPQLRQQLPTRGDHHRPEYDPDRLARNHRREFYDRRSEQHQRRLEAQVVRRDCVHR